MKNEFAEEKKANAEHEQRLRAMGIPVTRRTRAQDLSVAKGAAGQFLGVHPGIVDLAARPLMRRHRGEPSSPLRWYRRLEAELKRVGVVS